MTSEAAPPDVTFGVLGPLEAADRHGPLALKGPRHRAVLARLLIARGRVVPVDRLAADLWERPPDGAAGAIQTFVAALRRALEPDRPPRAPARLLVTDSPGYALRAAPDAVDAWRFEAVAGAAGPLLAAGRAGEALARLDRALALWRGPAYAQFTAEAWAHGEITRLDGLRLLAVERRAEALLELGRAAEAVPDLAAHAGAHPLREDAWRLWALALYRSGRQGDALASLRRARETLAEELGVDPGPGLRGLEADILAQHPRLTAPAGTAEESGGPGRGTGASGGPDSDTGVPRGTAPPAGEAPATGAPAGRPFVGRARELALLEEAAATAVRRGGLALALVSGDPGAGKTALADALTGVLTGRGWTAAWGRCPEHDGAPGGWPWTRIVSALAASGAGLPPDSRVPPGSQAAGRFRAHQEAASYLSGVAADHGPVLLVVDDLHRAGEETLDLLTALVTASVAGPVLLVGTYRATEISPELTDALAGFARAEPARVYVGGLPETATDALVRTLVRHDVDPRTTRAVHRRSGGNPFFVRELARLVDSEGRAALDAVPAGVRDVIRHRLARLPDAARAVLRQAAVAGPDVDVEVLLALGTDEDVVLDALESALAAGFLTEQGPGRPRFAHALVRDTLYDDISGPRRARWHAAVGEAVERLRPDDTAALAHHFGRAESRATAARAARYARAAAVEAERIFAPHEAVRLWRQAVAAHDRGGEGDVRGRLEAVMGLTRALAVTGSLEAARTHRAEAVATAEALGDPALTAEVAGAFDVPAIWTRNDDEDLSRRIAGTIGRTLAALPGDQAARRARLLGALALELRSTAPGRGDRAAREAEAAARRLDDPALLGLALNGRFLHSFQRAGLAPERARIGTELVELAGRHGLVTFEVLGRLVLVQARSALADLTAADAHAAAADRLAERYDIPLAGVFTRWYAALRLTVAGRRADAEAAYRAAGRALAGSGMPGLAEGILPLALLCLRLQADGWAEETPAGEEARPATGAEESAADTEHVGDDAEEVGHEAKEVGDEAEWGPHAPWIRPLALLAAGRREAAGAALRTVPESPRDLLLEARLCLVARAAVAVGDRPVMAATYERLLPAEGELAGAGSGLLCLGPVGRHLGDLALALGERGRAADHYRRALEVARRAGAPHWATAARTALDTHRP
ncbi:BTAD domain-containing putative transcriptional regulator [Streptomyces sp. NPDC056987]|uniref:BTAD domain-containing putative transcriptional regulator n=1 Tax=Streptomyces sp. NPDC056987 TaxID=3345988 RepID=UPI0036370C22